MLEGILDYPADPTRPGMAPRKKYSPEDYGSLKQSGIYQALAGGAGQDTARMGKNLGVPDAGAINEYAQRQALGNMQPWDEKQRQAQYSSYLGQQDQQDALAQAIYEQQAQSAAAQQAAMGQLAGMGGGFLLGKKKGLFNNSKGLSSAMRKI